MAILDHRGNPVDTGLLTEEVAGAQAIVRDVWTDTVAHSLTPEKLAWIIQAAKEGDTDAFLTLAEDMEEREPHYGSVLSTRKLAIQGLDIGVEAASDEKRDHELADAVRDMVRSPEMEVLVESLLDGLGKGFAVCEIMWKRDSRAWVPEDYRWRDPRWFVIDIEQGEKIRLRSTEDMIKGEDLAAYKFIVHRPQLKKGLTIASGLARMAAVSFMCKSYVVRDWMRFMQNYGLPFRIGRYDRNASDSDVKVLKRAVAMIGSDAAAIIPEGMRIEFVKDQGGSTGGDATFERMAKFFDAQLSKRVLGQTMTADDGSSKAQAQVHDGVRDDIMRADANKLAATINRDLVKPFIDLNYGIQKNYPRVKFIIEDKADIQVISEALGKLVPLGLRVEQTEVRGILGLRDPDDDAEVLQYAPPGVPVKDASPKQDTAKNRAEVDTDTPEELDLIAQEELSGWRRQMQPVISPVEQLLKESDSYEDFVSKLTTLEEEMDVDAIVDALARATFKARGLGDAQDDLTV